MKILIRNSDHAVIHAGDDLVLTAVECVGDGWVDRNFNTSNAAIAEAELPDDWMGAEWSFSAGVWTLVSTEIYNQRQSTKLGEVKAALIWKIDADVDAIYADAVGNRGPEYDAAAADAVAYQAAGYTGTVPASVASWAAAKGWAAQAAADDILLAAGRLAAARDAIRAQRLLRKEQARAAADAEALEAVAGAWSGFVATIRTQLGV